MHPMRALFHIAHGHIPRLPEESNWSPLMHAFLDACCQGVPDSRRSADQLLKVLGLLPFNTHTPANIRQHPFLLCAYGPDKMLALRPRDRAQELQGEYD